MRFVIIGKLSFGPEQEGHVILFVSILPFFPEDRVIFPEIGLYSNIRFGHFYLSFINFVFSLLYTSIYRTFDFIIIFNIVLMKLDWMWYFNRLSDKIKSRMLLTLIFIEWKYIKLK